MRHTSICGLLLAIVALAFASKGGGGDKKNVVADMKNDFTPISASRGFTLRSGYSFSGSYVLSQQKNTNTISLNTMITYQKGNTVYLMPYRSNVNISALTNIGKPNNLQLVGVKIKLSK